MRKVLSYTLSACCFFMFFTCKKYDEGGFIFQTRLHLFGGHKPGDSKTWKLKLYEVNGIDSTQLILGAGNVPNYYNQFITFKYTQNDPGIKYTAETGYCNFLGYVDVTYKEVLFSPNREINLEDSTQCYKVNGSTICVRNILSPELSNRNPKWSIERLTKKEIIIKLQKINSYKIILSQ